MHVDFGPIMLFFNEEKKNQIFRISYYNIYFPKYSLNK